MVSAAKRIALIPVIFMLAASFVAQTRGQESPPGKGKNPRVVIKVDSDSEFVNGQRVEIGFLVAFQSGVKPDYEGLKNTGSDFPVVEFEVSPPVPVPTQRDYSSSSVRMVVEPKSDLNYGKHVLGKLFLNYSYVEARQIDTDKGRKITTASVVKKESVPAIVLEKVPVAVKIDLGNGFQDVVNIGEHLKYQFHIFYENEKEIEILNLSSAQELGRLKIKDAFLLNNPDFRPFAVINRDDWQLVQEKNHGPYSEITCNYILALYEISLVKSFEIPQLKIYHTLAGQDEIYKLTGPAIKIRTNSVLTKESQFRPLKPPLAINDEELYWFGRLPIAAARILLGIAGLMAAWLILPWLARKLAKTTPRGLIRLSIESVRGLPLFAYLRARRALKKLGLKPNQKNLQGFIIALRQYLGAMAGIKPKFALAMTWEELAAKLKIKAETLESAEYLLDEEIGPEETRIITEEFEKESKVLGKMRITRKITTIARKLKVRR